MAQSRAFTTGHTFAERKAQADADAAQLAKRRLVSLGESEFTQRNQRTGEVEVISAERPVVLRAACGLATLLGFRRGRAGAAMRCS